MERIIDADGHVTEPAGVWQDRIATKYCEAAPRLIRTDEGEDKWVIDGEISTVSASSTATGGFPGWPDSRPMNLDEVHPAAYDAKARLEYLDSVGIWAQVIYPNVGG